VDTHAPPRQHVRAATVRILVRHRLARRCALGAAVCASRRSSHPRPSQHNVSTHRPRCPPALVPHGDLLMNARRKCHERTVIMTSDFPPSRRIFKARARANRESLARAKS